MTKIDGKPRKKSGGRNEPPGGRPTKFKSKYTKSIIKFFDIEPYRKEVTESSTEYFATGAIKKKSEKFRMLANRLPTLFRFAQKIGVDYNTLLRWTEKGERDEGDVGFDIEFQRFRGSYKKAKELQKEFLISLGLSNSTAPASFIFVAKNITDMKDKVETEHSGEVLNRVVYRPERDKKG